MTTYEKTNLYLAIENNTDITGLIKPKIINKQNKYLWTPLHIAIRKKNMNVAMSLLMEGANPNIKNNLGWTPLHMTVHNNFTEIITPLLEHPDISVNEIDNDHQTPIFLSIQIEKNDGITKLLLEKKANANIANKYNNSPLLTLFEEEKWDLFDLALKNIGDNEKVTIGLKDVNINTLHELSQTKPNAFKLLISKNDIANLKDSNGYNLLHREVISENPNMTLIDILVETPSFKINEKGNEGNTPLHFASARDNKNIVVKLLENGANVNIENGIGETPFMTAINRKKWDNATELMDRTVTIDDNIKSKITLDILYNISSTKWDLAKKLITKGIDINMVDPLSGNNILHKAAENKDATLVNKLITDRLFTINYHANNNNETPLYIAIKAVIIGKNNIALKLLDKFDPDVESCCLAIKKQQKEILTKIMTHPNKPISSNLEPCKQDLIIWTEKIKGKKLTDMQKRKSIDTLINYIIKNIPL
jgi:ankyrin repeat protein